MNTLAGLYLFRTGSVNSAFIYNTVELRHLEHQNFCSGHFGSKIIVTGSLYNNTEGLSNMVSFVFSAKLLYFQHYKTCSCVFNKSYYINSKNF